MENRKMENRKYQNSRSEKTFRNPVRIAGPHTHIQNVNPRHKVEVQTINHGLFECFIARLMDGLYCCFLFKENTVYRANSVLLCFEQT
jgi:hypothetical protein